MTQAALEQDPTVAEISKRVRTTNVTQVARELGMSREQIARIAAGGIGVRPGTLALARERLAEEASRAGR